MARNKVAMEIKKKNLLEFANKYPAMTANQLAAQYGVTASAVRKWIKKREEGK